MSNNDIQPLVKIILEHNMPKESSYTLEELLISKFEHSMLPPLKGESAAMAMIKKTIANKGRILCVVDIDSDGLNGGAVCNHIFKEFRADVTILHGTRAWGRGFNPTLVSAIKKLHNGVPIELIITCDHGSGDYLAYVELKEHGIQNIIVTDHHEWDRSIPPDGTNGCDIFINPQQDDKAATGMSGCCVTFKVLSGLYRGTEGDVKDRLDRLCIPHVGISTVSDMMPLNILYNRILVRAAIDYMNEDQFRWKMIQKLLNLPKTFRFVNIGFNVSPFINTGNRVGREDLVLTVLTTDDPVILELAVADCVKLNTMRKQNTRQYAQKLMESIIKDPEAKTLVILTDVSININGILAGNIGNDYKVPTIAFSLNEKDKVYSGSARGILEHIHVVEVFKAIEKISKDLLISYGGHKGAGGCRVPFDKINEFKKAFETVVQNIPVPVTEDKEPFIIPVNTAGLKEEIVDIVNIAGPFGVKWDEPVFKGLFRLKYVRFLNSMAILDVITAGGLRISGVYFYNGTDNKKYLADTFRAGSAIELLFKPQYYRRGNTTKFSLQISKISGFSN